jgi:Flp pilus assembly protein TadG
MTRLLSDRRGIALTEFALCLPFLVLLYVGGYQLSDAMSAYRKVTITTRTVADLTSQYTAVSDDDIGTILNASAQVLAPYNISASTITVSQVAIDGKLNATIDWSKTKTGTGASGNGIAPGTEVSTSDLPNAVRQANTYLIIASVNYSYTPLVAGNLIGPIAMHDQIIMGPRAASEVQYTT